MLEKCVYLDLWAFGHIGQVPKSYVWPILFYLQPALLTLKTKCADAASAKESLLIKHREQVEQVRDCYMQ